MNVLLPFWRFLKQTSTWNLVVRRTLRSLIPFALGFGKYVRRELGRRLQERSAPDVLLFGSVLGNNAPASSRTCYQDDHFIAESINGLIFVLDAFM